MFTALCVVVVFSGLLAFSDYAVPGEVYAWIAVFVLPVNSALNPFLYTLTAVLGKKVIIIQITSNA